MMVVVFQTPETLIDSHDKTKLFYLLSCTYNLFLNRKNSDIYFLCFMFSVEFSLIII